jgi:hypothetical protein
MLRCVHSFMENRSFRVVLGDSSPEKNIHREWSDTRGGDKCHISVFGGNCGYSAAGSASSEDYRVRR